MQFTERIDRILLLLAERRALTSTQIAERLELEGYSRQYTNRKLGDLFDHGFIDKLGKEWPRTWRKGGGSFPDIWALSNRGGEYLEVEFGIPRSAAQWREKNRTVKSGYIKHSLLISEVMLAFERSCARRGDVRLIYPREILESAPEATRAQRKPLEWQVEAEWQKVRLKLPVVPDKPFGLEFTTWPGENRLWFKFEADSGSETVMPQNPKKADKPSIFHKFLGYRATYQQRLHQARFGIKAFRVLTVTERNGVAVVRHPQTGERVKRTRVENMQAAAMLASGGVDPGFFLFSDLATLRSHEDVLSMHWRRVDGKPVMLTPA